MDNTENLLLEINKTYEGLIANLDAIKSLKTEVSKITNATSELIKAAKELSNDQNIDKLNKERGKTIAKINEDIVSIRDQVSEIEVYKDVFEDMMYSFTRTINNKNNEFTESLDKAKDLSKNFSDYSARLKKEIKENDKNGKRLKKIGEEIHLANKYNEIKKEQKEQRVLLEKILEKLD